MSGLHRRFILALIFIFVATLARTQGITTGTVTGTIYDPSGALVPGAHVELTNLANGLRLEAKSGGEGAFQFFAVPIGMYRAVVTAAGFSTENIENINVVAGTTTNLNDVRLRIGATQQLVVNASMASLLETTDSQASATFSTETVQNLPLNNGFDTIAEVLPGVVSTGDDDFSNANGDNYSVNGQSGRYNNFEIDGQLNDDNTIGGPNAFFGSPDAIAEIQVVTNDYSAQYGRNAGAVVNYITKSGTNRFHGSAFDSYQGQFLSSLPNQNKNPVFDFCPPGVSASTGCTAPFLPHYVENRAGATIGGPILRDKLFFFFSTYWDRIRQGASPAESLPSLTPDAAGLATIQSAFASDPGAGAIAQYGPFSDQQGNPQSVAVPASFCPGTPTASGMCDETITDAGGNSATVEFAGVVRSLPYTSDDQEELARVDWQPTDKDHLFVRFFYQPSFATGVAGYDGIAGGDFFNIPATTYSVGADWTHTFTPHFVDQLRYSFQESKSYFEGGAYPNCLVSNFSACPAEVYFDGGNDDLSFGGDSSFPQGRTVKVTQVQDNATWTHGAQTLLFGGEFDYQDTPEAGLAYYNGMPTYPTFSNLLGTAAGGYYGSASGLAYLADGDLVIPFTEPDVAAYFQDDWKVIPTLTLHLGVRWEFFGQSINKLHQDSVSRESNPSTAFWSTALPLSARTVPYVNQVYTNFEPRIGLAWNPEMDRKLVVRAGYAINANPEFYAISDLVASDAPFTNTGGFYCGSNACLPSNGSLLASDFRALNLSSLPTGGDPGLDVEGTIPTNFRTPYVQTYTLAIDHQIGNAAVFEARYTGSKTTDDFQSVDGNPYMLPVATAFPSYISPSSLCSDPSADGYGRPNCDVGNVAGFINGGWANYNGLQLNLTTQNYHGLTSTVSYTWSKAINNATDAYVSTGRGGSTLAFPQNPLDPDVAERGLSGNDFPNVVGLEFTYDLPKLISGNGFLARAANGVLFSGLYRYRSGQVYTPTQPLVLDDNTGDSSFCDAAFNADVLGTDTCRLVLSNKKAPINTVAYLNPYVNGPAPYSPVAGTPQYVVYQSDGFDSSGDYNPGTPIDPANAHWIINNQAYALLVGNPYPGSSRSLLRGQPFSDLDLTIVKTIRINERVSMQLSMAAYNALNQMFLGVGNPNVAATNFTSNAENSSGSVPGNTSGNRFVILGGKFTF